jgi:hypothetical protein
MRISRRNKILSLLTALCLALAAPVYAAAGKTIDSDVGGPIISFAMTPLRAMSRAAASPAVTAVLSVARPGPAMSVTAE